VVPSTTVKASEPPRCCNAPPATRGTPKKSAKEKIIESTMVTVTAPRLISMSSALALTLADHSIAEVPRCSISTRPITPRMKGSRKKAEV
jgi:hypothetical protein